MSKSKRSPVFKVSRRDFLKVASIASGAAIVAGCAPKVTEALPTSTEALAVKPTAVPPTATGAAQVALAPTDTPLPAPTLGPTPDANGCVVDWFPTYPPFAKYEPALDISVPFSASYDFSNNPEDSIQNNPMYNRIVNQLGIKYQIAWQADGNDYYTRLNNDMAANTLPDSFRCKNAKIGSFVDTGAVEDITDLWEKNATELTKQKKGYPDHLIWREVTRNGRIFGIAYKEDGLGDDSLTMIRQDWLDQVKLPAPKTVDDITAVARAFKKAGLCDFPIGACQTLVTWDFSLDPVFGAYGVVPAGWDSGAWFKNADGSLRYSSLDTGAKEALAVLNTWYKEELIDPDFINQDEMGPNDNFMAGKIGICFQPWWAGHANVWDLYTAFPEAKITVLPNPVGPSGKSGRAGTLLKGQSVLFRKGVDPKIIEAVIQHMNWQIDMHVNWEKYQQYGEWLQGAGYFRSYEWDLTADCQMTTGRTPGSEWSMGKDLIGGFRGVTYPDYPADSFASMAEWAKKDPSQLNMAQKFILADLNTQRDIEYYNIALRTRSEILATEFTGANTEAISAVLTDLLDFEKGTFLEFITGAKSLDDFDAFVQEWMDRGGKVYTEEVNKWAAANG